MKKKKTIHNHVEENFYSIIICLVLFFTVILIAMLFFPIITSRLPDTDEAIALYNAGINKRTIAVRIMASIMSAISVIIAFTSIKQSKQSDQKKERMQVMPFPAYKISKDNNPEKQASSLTIRREIPHADILVKNYFEMNIRNIGLGSLMDYEIEGAGVENIHHRIDYLDVSFSSSCILGKEENINIGMNMIAAFKNSEEMDEKSLTTVNLSCHFKDLLGNEYSQKLVIESKISFLQEKKDMNSNNKQRITKIYSIEPVSITHAPPMLQKNNS